MCSKKVFFSGVTQHIFLFLLVKSCWGTLQHFGPNQVSLRGKVFPGKNVTFIIVYVFIIYFFHVKILSKIKLDLTGLPILEQFVSSNGYL